MYVAMLRISFQIGLVLVLFINLPRGDPGPSGSVGEGPGAKSLGQRSGPSTRPSIPGAPVVPSFRRWDWGDFEGPVIPNVRGTTGALGYTF